jgi:hypothetical protein
VEDPVTTTVRRRKPVEELRYGPMRPCARCGQTAPIAARELCDTCWYHAKKDGTLADYPGRMTGEELLAEYELLASAGNTHEVIAQRLGYQNPYYLRNRISDLGGKPVPTPHRKRGRPRRGDS